MKALKTMALTAVTVLLVQIGYAQNYKAPNIDASGNFKNKNGKSIGKVSPEGVMDAIGTKMASVDAEGSLIDASGKKLGKAEKNGNFSYVNPESGKTKNFVVSEPSNGVCEVKDENGKTVLLVHENYKTQASCAYHCLQMKKQGKTMKMK